MASMKNLIKNGDLAGVQRAVQDDPALLDATVTTNKHTPLMWAVHPESGGQPAIAQWLIERGAKLDLQDNIGWAALMLACRYDQPDTAQLLIQRGAKLDLQTNDGWTALMLACQPPSESHHTAAGLLRSLKLCFAAGADLDLKKKNGRDALALAKDCKRADAVAFLEFATMLEVARGVQGSLQQPRSVVAASLLPQDDEDTEPEAILDRAQVWYEKNQTPLMHACKKGDLARAKKLVAGGAQIDARDNLGLTPMIYACKFNKEEDSLSLAKLLFEHSAGLSSESLGISDALAHASLKDRIELSTFLSFMHSIPLDHFHSNALRVIVVKLFDQGVRTLEEARRLTPARLEQLGVSSAPDRRDFFRAFVDSEQIASLEVLAAKVTLARTKRKEGKPILHPRLAKVFAEQVLRKDPVAYFADFDMQQVFLREREKDLMTLQEAVKTDSTKIAKRDETRRELVEGIRKALSGGIEGQLENTLADPGSKAVIDTCQSLWKEVLKEFLDADNAHAPVTFEDVQEATQAAMEAIKYWETRHDTSAACERTEATIDALNESIKRLGIEPTFLMTFRHPEKTRDLAMELHNVQQSLNAELSILTGVDPMADAPLEEVRRALASTISFYNCTVKNEVSRLQKAAKHLSSSLSRHVPGLVPPDTSRVINIMNKIRTSKREQIQLKYEIDMATLDEKEGKSKVKERVKDLKEKLSKAKGVFRLKSDLCIERERVLRHADKQFPELSQDTKWLESIGMAECVPKELIKLGIWLTDVTLEDFETLETLTTKLGKSVLKVRDPDGQEFVLKIFQLTDQSLRSRFYRQVAALAQIQSAYVVRFQSAFLHGTSQGCILMPFYAGGDLAAWIRDNPLADVPTRTRIAIGLLSGLHDLHSREYVHCDVKPENIFLAPGLSPVLGDFDGVQMHNVTMTQPMQATYRYMAPELRNKKVDKVESAVDLFSVGVVLADLFENTKVSDATKSLISSLQSTDPTQRPTALQALRHEAFQVEPVNQASCAVCLDIYPISEGVSCADDHFTCKECLSESVLAATQPDAHVEVRRDGSMCCVTPGCELLISGRAIASAVPDEDFTALLDIVRKHFERDAAAEQERQLQLRLAAALREHELHPATQDHIRTIQNEILTMSCPRCSAAFVDFDGCCALECGACPCRFCAWCLQDTGNDSQACHQHVASCASKPAGEDRFFGQKHVVRQVWCRLRAQRLRDYMAKRVQDAGIRASVQNKLRPLLTPDIVGDNFSF